MKLDLDSAMEVAGGFGFIQRVHFGIICLVQLFQASFIMGLVFIGREPAFTCKGREAEGSDPCSLNPPCETFAYSKDFTSIVSEWDLVCEHRRVASYAQSLLMFGFLTGVVILGRTSDKIGRLRTFVWGFFALLAVQAASAFTQNIYQYVFSRFLIGFLNGGAGLAGHILMLEGLLPRLRALLSTVHHCLFAAGIAMFAVMAYFVRDWRHLSLVLCLPMLSFIAVPLVVPESARWLASQGRIAEVEDQLLYFGKKNGVKLSRAMVSLAPATHDTKGKESDGILDLFRTPKMRRRMMTLVVTWFTCCMAYYGLTFEASNLGGNMYVNFALSGLLEIPASLLSIYTFNRVGRRPTMAGSLFIAGAACLSVMVLPRSEDGQMSTVQTCLALTGKMGISVAFNSAYLFSSELLPTVLRNTGIGICSMAARVGGIIAPCLPPFGGRVAYGVFGIFALLSGLLDLTLPETLNKRLPQTVTDVETGPVTLAPPQGEKNSNLR